MSSSSRNKKTKKLYLKVTWVVNSNPIDVPYIFFLLTCYENSFCNAVGKKINTGTRYEHESVSVKL